ncbi:MAG: methyltransferase domain-containing protein [Rhodospirillales bacterium]
MINCRICATPLKPFMDFGQMPIGGAFISTGQFEDEYFYHMKIAVCSECATLQVMDVPDPERMFNERYAYFSSTSKFMMKHFQEFSEELISKWLPEEDQFVVEIGSNDGITLQNFAKAGIRHLGVEPSSSVANAAREKGLNVLENFFNVATAEKIYAEHGPADILIATNTMHNIEDINSVAAGVSILLKPGGIMVQEDPYLGDVIEDTAYDQLYAEHMYIWSITSLNNAFGRHNLEIFDAEKQKFHGGCMRYFLCHKGAHEKTLRLKQYITKEKKIGLANPATYDAFKGRCEQSRDRLVSIINNIKKEGKTIVGYGATAKSATIINFCGLTKNHIDYLSDTTPKKQGLYSPGAHIPVRSPENFSNNYPDYAILFAWNHFEEIAQKEKMFRELGGKWIHPVRMVEIF